MENRRKNHKFDKINNAIEKYGPKVYFAFWGVVLLGIGRAIAYGFGASLTHHWYDLPAQWIAKIVL